MMARIQLWFPGPLVFLDDRDVTDGTHSIVLRPGGIAIIQRYSLPFRIDPETEMVARDPDQYGDYEVLVRET